ncbi:nicotinate-nucleotide adenylyltransferase [Paracoccus bogoriensis]|uniref:nicotinate-nucleotide adenylyltransferase n=1 Tax=Paracoccus bogoriensis TaxID=242065 RepID=UPI001CA49F63|nr:nicotinate-nucleotide adenylyltransferase [Paracoccus bogoriensis]MBW7055729.1 nicotinate-nucleotide adenylyltransferase [Paracoccus bogoriensis]
MRTGYPIAMPGQRIGLLGGSFDPAHRGHLGISRVALSRLSLDRVWWLVSPGNPLKPNGPAPLLQRLEGARRLVGDPRILVTDLEARLRLRKTADTVAALRRLYPGVRFVWLMGSDNLAQFHLWDRWRAIADAVPFAVLARPGSRLSSRNAPAARALRAARLPEWRAAELALRRPPAWTLLDLPLSPLSSTALRYARHEN